MPNLRIITTNVADTSTLAADPSPAAERDHMVYGKRRSAAFALDLPLQHAHTIEMEGW